MAAMIMIHKLHTAMILISIIITRFFIPAQEWDTFLFSSHTDCGANVQTHPVISFPLVAISPCSKTTNNPNEQMDVVHEMTTYFCTRLPNNK